MAGSMPTWGGMLNAPLFKNSVQGWQQRNVSPKATSPEPDGVVASGKRIGSQE